MKWTTVGLLALAAYWLLRRMRFADDERPLPQRYLDALERMEWAKGRDDQVCWSWPVKKEQA